MDRRFDETNKNMDQKLQDISAAIKFSYADLDKRITSLEINLK
jgi:hypothetical protein